MEILLSEENGLADIRQELGRLVNAIVAVLGPELAPGSTFFSRCKVRLRIINGAPSVFLLLNLKFLLLLSCVILFLVTEKVDGSRFGCGRKVSSISYFR